MGEGVVRVLCQMFVGVRGGLYTMPDVCRSQRGFVIYQVFVGVKGGFCNMPYVCRSHRGIV